MGSKDVAKRLLWDVLLIDRMPDRRFRQAWDVLQAMNVAFNVLVVPFCVSYLESPLSSGAAGMFYSIPFKKVLLVFDILYLLDMAMQTRYGLWYWSESGVPYNALPAV